MTTVQELISEFEEIKKTKCKTVQEVMFFDGVLAIIEGKYLEKEKQQIIDACYFGSQNLPYEVKDKSEQYYNEKFENK